MRWRSKVDSVHMRYDAVIFDLFGTLTPTVTPADYDAMLQELADALGAPAGAFRERWRASMQERESGGFGDMEGVLRTIGADAGAQPSKAALDGAGRSWRQQTREWLRPRPVAVATVSALGEAGYPVGLISNCSAEVPVLWPDTRLSAVIDSAVFSCEMGLMKPEPAIYRHVCGLLEVRPERCLFVGDGGARELTGARAVGMDATLLRVGGEEHTWFDSNYRLDALEWTGATITALDEVLRLADVRQLLAAAASKVNRLLRPPRSPRKRLPSSGSMVSQ